jgi:hypothetical protein
MWFVCLFVCLFVICLFIHLFAFIFALPTNATLTEPVEEQKDLHDNE